jgi:transcriptional regulator with XRE-family HTH domain
MRKSSNSILEVRQRLGLSMSEMASLMECAKNYIYLIESGRKPMTEKMKAKLDEIDKSHSSPSNPEQQSHRDSEHLPQDLRCAVHAPATATSHQATDRDLAREVADLKATLATLTGQVQTLTGQVQTLTTLLGATLTHAKDG